MKIKVHFLGLSEEQRFCVTEMLPHLSILLADDGIRVTVKAGKDLSLCRDGDGVVLTYTDRHTLFRLLSMLSDFIESKKEKFVEKKGFDLLSYMADMSRNAVYNIPAAKKMIRLLALSGYNSLMLYTEDTYEMPEYPYFGYMRGRFTKDELKELDDYAYAFGIELIPCIQTLAHLDATVGWRAHVDMVDIDNILLVGEGQDATYRFIETMFKTCRECFRSRRINIGMDEAHNLGRGKYIDQNGYRPKAEIMIDHLRRVVAIAKKYDFDPMMWSDMFFRMQFDGQYYIKEGNVKQEVIDLVPPEVELIYWDYYTTPEKKDMFAHMVECHKQFKNNRIGFAGGVSKWYGFTAINAFSINSARLQMDVSNAQGIRDIIITAWGDSGGEASQFSILPSMLYYAERTYTTDEPTREWMDARCKQCFCIGYDDLLKIDLPAELGMTDGKRIQPSNYLLFNDPINGLLDGRMEADKVADYYKAHTEALRPLAEHPEWGYLYDTLYRLCDVLSLKSDLSVRIRRAYKAGERETLVTIVDTEIPEIIARLEHFWLALRRQWLTENKSFGLDVQEIRLGAIRQRLLSAQLTLRDYLDGKVERIEELEQEQLPFILRGGSTVCENNPYSTYHSFNKIITACVMD